MLKAAFFDLDGTIVNASGGISSAVKKEITRIQSLGVAVCFATGRPNFGAKQFIAELQIKHASTFHSGALVIEPSSNRVVREVTIDRKALLPLIENCREHSLTLELYTSKAHFVERETELSMIHVNHYLKVPTQIRSFDDLLASERILKAVVMIPTDCKKIGFDEMTAATGMVSASSKGAAHPDISFWNFTAAEATREAAFNAMLKDLGIKAQEVVAFGDSDSDADFLRLAGVGVAMGNGSERCKQSADIIADTAENDGVAKVLRELVGFNVKK